jgi:hypothetical protein
MTEFQLDKIADLRQEYLKNVEMYLNWDSENVCQFHIYESTIQADPNIVLVMVTIVSVDDSYSGCHTQTEKMIITPDGNALELSSTFSDMEVVHYIKTLKRII